MLVGEKRLVVEGGKVSFQLGARRVDLERTSGKILLTMKDGEKPLLKFERAIINSRSLDCNNVLEPKSL